MNTLGIKPSSGFTPSATFSHYDFSGAALVNQSALSSNSYYVMFVNSDGKSTQANFGSIISSYPLYFRCVRDVD